MVRQGGSAQEESFVEDERNSGGNNTVRKTVKYLYTLQVEEDLSRAAKSRRKELEKLMKSIKV